MDDTTLISQLSPEPGKRRHQGLVCPDWIEVHNELKQKGVTKQLVWEPPVTPFSLAELKWVVVSAPDSGCSQGSSH